ncbi:MAG: NAD(P)/FAD-dependent oxidoreductase [Pseudomonadota bacterium]
MSAVAKAATSGRSRLVVVGNGMAAARTLEELLSIAPERYDVTVLGAEPYANYNRILLTPLLAGEMGRAEIMLNDREWYASRGVALQLGCRVAAIDRVRREVMTEDGRRFGYDRLLLATGSQPVVLPIPGRGLPGVLTYRDLGDTEAMIAAAQPARDAVVIGGGLLGIEAANGLAARGMRVTLVHLMPTLMERQLDDAAAAMLRGELAARGIAVETAARTAAFVAGADGRVAAVRLEGGRALPAALAVMAVGIRPNAALAEAAGLPCERGVAVSDTMQTNDPRIYAVGECVAHRGVTYGLVSPVYAMARVCANHLAGAGFASYRGSVPCARLKVSGIDVFSAGEIRAADGDEELTLADAGAGVYRKLVLRDGRLAGAVLYGDVEGAADYEALLAQRTPVAPLRGRLLFPALWRDQGGEAEAA